MSPGSGIVSHLGLPRGLPASQLCASNSNMPSSHVLRQVHGLLLHSSGRTAAWLQAAAHHAGCCQEGSCTCSQARLLPADKHCFHQLLSSTPATRCLAASCLTQVRPLTGKPRTVQPFRQQSKHSCHIMPDCLQRRWPFTGKASCCQEMHCCLKPRPHVATHREAQHCEALGAILLVQLLKLGVLGREAARAGEVDHQAHLALELIHLGAAAVDILRGGGQGGVGGCARWHCRRCTKVSASCRHFLVSENDAVATKDNECVIHRRIRAAKRRSLASEARFAMNSI